MKLLLAKNPALSVKQIAPKKQQSITPGKNPLSKKNKYFNIPVYVFPDGFVFVDEDNQIKSLAASELPKIHGKVTAKFDSVKEYERISQRHNGFETAGTTYHSGKIRVSRENSVPYHLLC